MNHFLSGAVFMAACTVALFLLRFWKDSGDRFFLIFSTAFILMGLERVSLLLTDAGSEMHNSSYLLRLLGFVLILVAIQDKNRTRNREPR